jgi:segregation and condensation protein B
MAATPPRHALDRDLAHLPSDQRWRLWMARVEAVLFASATPVPREALARVVGQEVSLDLLLADLAADLADRPYEVAQTGGGWTLRTRPAFAPAIRAAADIPGRPPGLTATEAAVLAAIAWHQPVSRADLHDIFGHEISRDLIARLAARDLIATGPRAPRRGAPHTFVTTDTFLSTFGLTSLRDLPDPGDLPGSGGADSGAADTGLPTG